VEDRADWKWLGACRFILNLWTNAMSILGREGPTLKGGQVAIFFAGEIIAEMQY